MSGRLARIESRSAAVVAVLARHRPSQAAVPRMRGRLAGVRGWAATVAAVLARPRLWPVALCQWRMVVPHGWWRRRPHLPVPDRSYLSFRRVTQYGDGEATVAPADVVHYLTWCRQMRSSAR